ncbi:MAG: hypothetical protein K2O40_03860 [Lachnospiraceae bacterium]|nr:hypothetical protein [Lachnospiraceae bacterium]
MEWGCFPIYPVSEKFLQAVQENTRHYYWTGRITTAAVNYLIEHGDGDLLRWYPNL